MFADDWASLRSHALPARSNKQLRTHFENVKAREKPTHPIQVPAPRPQLTALALLCRCDPTADRPRKHSSSKGKAMNYLGLTSRASSGFARTSAVSGRRCFPGAPASSSNRRPAFPRQMPPQDPPSVCALPRDRATCPNKPSYASLSSSTKLDIYRKMLKH